MRLAEGVEWSLHCVALAAVLPPDRALSAARLAEYHGVPAAYLAKQLQALARAGILEASAGPRGGYRLARPAGEITVLEVVEAIEGAGPSFHCAEIRRRGPAALPGRAYPLPCSIHLVMDRADAAWRSALRDTTVADLLGLVAETAAPEALVKGGAWLQEVLR